jgi:hypothetical protein
VRRDRIAALVLAVAVVVGAACSGGDDDGDDSGGGGRDSTTTAPAGGFEDLLDRQDTAVIKITYRRGDDEFTIAQDGQRRAITSGTTKVITTPGATINCTDIDTEPECLDVPEGVNSIVNVGLSYYELVSRGLAAAAQNLPGIRTTKDRVAGRSATCADADPGSVLEELTQSLGDVDIPSGRARVCLDDETGFLLEFGTGDPAQDLVATEVGTPTDADFEPPAPLSDVPKSVSSTSAPSSTTTTTVR